MMIPFIRYDDAPAALDWLTRAFGFEQNMVVPGDEGKITHAQLTYGRGMVMIGSTRDSSVLPQPVDQEYGSRDYGALDPEGNLWTFGTYDPFAQGDD
jgi:uncharacterized glyoxalase superfamily protein PhnB